MTSKFLPKENNTTLLLLFKHKTKKGRNVEDQNIRNQRLQYEDKKI